MGPPFTLVEFGRLPLGLGRGRRRRGGCDTFYRRSSRGQGTLSLLSSSFLGTTLIARDGLGNLDLVDIHFVDIGVDPFGDDDVVFGVALEQLN